LVCVVSIPILSDQCINEFRVEQLWSVQFQKSSLELPRNARDLLICRLSSINLSLAGIIAYTMGWFSSSDSTPSPPKPKISADGTPVAPDRSERAKCWEARDIYFQCLEKHDIVDSIKEEQKAVQECSLEGKGFEANCATSWVSLGLLFFHRLVYICMAFGGLLCLGKWSGSLEETDRSGF
jgi:hypothetical protein